MSALVGVCMAINVVFAQAAATQPHPDSWFGIDKIKHFFMSAFIESVSYSLLQASGVHHRSAMGGAIGITLGFGVAREIHDKRTPGNIFSVRDLTWDAIGTGAGAVLLSHTIR
ncbi:MAG TPA: VanZ family protein [Gemmatimonadaceae bacterium]|nr:VanZ family protein [Gemmatimonadaceae bacterium]